MTKKDYELIARAIKFQWQLEVKVSGLGERSAIVHRTALRIANALNKAEPKFDIDKFLTACGIEHDYEGARQASKDSED